MTILGHKKLVQGVLPNAKPYVAFLQEVKSNGFELHNHMSYVRNGSYFTRDHSEGTWGYLVLLLPTFKI